MHYVSFLDIFQFKRAPTYSDSDNDTSELSKNTSLKSGALNKVSNFVGRGVSKAKFVLKGPNADKYKDWLYALNVKPNPNQTSSVFLAEIGKTLIEEGEVLIFVRNGSLFIADSYSVEEKSLDGHRYRVSTSQGLTVDEVFKHDEIILLKNENDNLNSFVEKLWEDWGELLGRLINRQKTANQIRFTLKMPKDRLREKAQEFSDGGAKNKESSQKKFFNRVVDRIKNDSVVAIPITGNDGDYNEYSNRYSSKASFVEDIGAVKNQYVDEICEIIGIAPALIHGAVADNEKNQDMAIENVLEPILQKFVDGLQEAIFSDEEYAHGNRIKVVGLHQYNLFDIATSGDKLIAAGLAMADEIREEIGFEPLPNGLGKRLYITKNYLEMRVEGGTVDEGNSSEGGDSLQQQ